MQLQGAWESARPLEPGQVPPGHDAARPTGGWFGVGIRHAVRPHEDESLCLRPMDPRVRGAWPGAAPQCQECRVAAQQEAESN